MIDTSELRIGSLYLDPKGEVKKWEFSIDDWGLYETEEYYKMSGIPLNEEWLLKAGFKDGTYGSYFKSISTHAWLVVSLKERMAGLRENISVADHDIDIEVKYVHQIQNLYYALKQTELTFNL